MTNIYCPLCKESAKGGYHIGDDTVYVCEICGGYRLSGTAEHLIKIGTISNINVDKIREIIRGRRGDSNEFPTITEYDF